MINRVYIALLGAMLVGVGVSAPSPLWAADRKPAEQGMYSGSIDDVLNRRISQQQERKKLEEERRKKAEASTPAARKKAKEATPEKNAFFSMGRWMDEQANGSDKTAQD